uniref:t-SNARE coiled-coil homology domain-containing protein n=1 Tax=Chenopodium quinoa TaxID=63459 RepID=A0A803LR92_CHEQI
MSFQDIRNGGGRPTSSSRSSAQSPSQAVAAGIFQINTAVSSFRRLVDAIGTSKDTPDHRQKLHTTRQRILQLVKDTSAKLKALSDSDHSANVTQSKKIEDAKLARDFQATLQEFQNVQQLASERESSYVPSGAPTSVVTDSSVEEAKQDLENQPFLLDQKRQELVLLDNEVVFNEAIIEEREQGIKEVQSQIGQVNEIFMDLAVLVHEQGVVIDDIHSNIEASAAVTSQAKQQLSKASKSERTVSLVFVLVYMVGMVRCCSNVLPGKGSNYVLVVSLWGCVSALGVNGSSNGGGADEGKLCLRRC